MDKDFENEKLNRLAEDVLNLAKNTLTVNFRFLDIALGQFEYAPQPDADIATDGFYLYYDPYFVLNEYKEEKDAMTRNYMHLVLHCIYRHMFVNQNIDQDYWDLACDMAVENTINEMNSPSCSCARQYRQLSELEKLTDKVKPFTAEKIYRYLLRKGLSPERLHRLRMLFMGDNHEPWYVPEENLMGYDSDSSDNNDKNDSSDSSDENQDDPGEDSQNMPSDSDMPQGQNTPQNQQLSPVTKPNMSKAEREQNWKDISEKLQMDLETFAQKRGDFAGNLSQSIGALNREKYDYSEFLKKFSVLGEAIQINDDEFDHIFYTYGLSLYEKMPLIEPLEYKEVKRIREFVIAIDTSGSVSGPLVRKFIEKTYNILKQRENFFTKINIHIIQCDCAIQEDKKITSQEEFDDYMEEMELHGFGGTDFRPVFAYVDELVRSKELTNLKGLIYFTDGSGIFPAQKPKYDTAFVFIDDEYNQPEVPVWAIRILLQSEDI
ncbi:MAG: metallopeptidase [Firmicutes bacterium]|nr:metallopeptidase [Bacillota bacterium]